MDTTVSLAISAAAKLIEFILKARQAARQSGEWTPEQEEQFQAELAMRMNQPHWQPDPS